MAAAFAAVTLRVAALPMAVGWAMLHGCAWLGGIGFTMSLFIANLAFEGAPLDNAHRILEGSYPPYFARGFGRIWNFTTFGLVPLPPSWCQGVYIE